MSDGEATEAAAKRARVSREQPLPSPQLALARVAERYASQPEQVSGCFLVVPGAVPDNFCAAVLPELLSRHRPQEIVYRGNGDEGTSYTNSWRISTYLVTTPSTYVYQCFKEQYGAPFDTELRHYVVRCGLMQVFEALKAQFLATYCAAKGMTPAEAEELAAATQLAQMFLTDQPGRDRMEQLDTYMQPHYDPSVLTINLHLSPLAFRGCPPAENGLRVFATDATGRPTAESRVFATPPGTAVFIWEDEDGSSCLHTANDISGAPPPPRTNRTRRVPRPVLISCLHTANDISGAPRRPVPAPPVPPAAPSQMGLRFTASAGAMLHC